MLDEKLTQVRVLAVDAQLEAATRLGESSPTPADAPHRQLRGSAVAPPLAAQGSPQMASIKTKLAQANAAAGVLPLMDAMEAPRDLQRQADEALLRAM